jgi:hypothetical protein
MKPATFTATFVAEWISWERGKPMTDAMRARAATFTVTVRGASTHSFRRWLKAGWRSYGLKVIAAYEHITTKVSRRCRRRWEHQAKRADKDHHGYEKIQRGCLPQARRREGQRPPSRCDRRRYRGLIRQARFGVRRRHQAERQCHQQPCAGQCLRRRIRPLEGQGDRVDPRPGRIRRQAAG